MATADDVRAVKEQVAGMERALLELQARAEQAYGALQDMQAAAIAGSAVQHAQRRAAANSSRWERSFSCCGHETVGEREITGDT